MTDSWKFWGLASFFCILTLAGCGRQNDPSDVALGPSPNIPEVTVTTVKRAVLRMELVVNGNLSGPPNRDAKLAALVPGRVTRVLVTEGDSVREGQVLVELENGPLRDQVRQAEASVSQAKASLENARISVQRNEGLLLRGIVARKDVEDVRTQFAVQGAALRQAEAALSAARAQLARSEIRAPFSGTVVRRFVGIGDQVDGTAAQPLVEVANMDALELWGSVPASRLIDLQSGVDFSFQTDAVPGVSFRATVVSVLPAVDPATNNGAVRVRILNPKHLLKVGQYLSLTLPLKGHDAALVVPRQAVYPGESGEPHVYRLRSGIAQAVAVKLGVQTQDEAEVLSGLTEGETIILAGGYGLPSQAKVRIRQ